MRNPVLAVLGSLALGACSYQIRLMRVGNGATG